MILTQCAVCATELGLSLGKKCGRCSTRYCGAACQVQHWKEGGHDQLCKQIKRAGGAEQFYANKKYTEAVAVAAEACAEDTRGQTCYICTQALHWKTKEGLVRGCACRGTAGFAHVSCLVEQAKILVAEAEENNLDDNDFNTKWRRWDKCSMCEQWYHSGVACALGWACWKTYVGRPEADWPRRLAIEVLGNGLSAAAHYDDALPVREAELAMRRRLGDPEENILNTQSNLATTYARHGRMEQALRLREDVYSGTLRLHGDEHRDSLMEANSYAYSLITLKRFAKAKTLLRKTLPVGRRILGDSNETTLRLRWNYADALCQDPGATLDDLREAVMTLEDTARIARRVLGGTHPHTAGIEDALRDARTVLRTHEAEATEAAAQDAFRTARVKLAQERSELAEALADMRVADEKG